MAFKFNVKPMVTEPMDRIDLLQAQEELNNAWMNLTDAQKSMEEVCEVMENIQTSVDLITKYGAAGVEQLNVDGSLEALLQVPAKLITAEKAQEGLGDAAKAAWEKLKGWIKRIIEIVKNFFRGLGKKMMNLFDSTKRAIEKLKGAPDDKIADALKDTMVNGTSGTTEGYGEYFKDFDASCVLPAGDIETFLQKVDVIFMELDKTADADATEVKTAMNNAISWKKKSASGADTTRDETFAQAKLMIFNDKHKSLDEKFKEIGSYATRVANANAGKQRSLYELGYRDKNTILKVLTDLTAKRATIERLDNIWYKEVEDIESLTEKCLTEYSYYPSEKAVDQPIIRTAGNFISEMARLLNAATSSLLRVTNATRSKLESVVDKVTISSARAE